MKKSFKREREKKDGVDQFEIPYKLEVENEFNEAETSYYNYKMYDTFETQLTKLKRISVKFYWKKGE